MEALPLTRLRVPQREMLFQFDVRKKLTYSKYGKKKTVKNGKAGVQRMWSGKVNPRRRSEEDFGLKKINDEGK